MINKFAIVTIHEGNNKNLLKTINSVNSQSIKPELHIIICKNYNTSILSYKKKYNKFIFKKDRSIYNAVNIGLSYTKNYFLFFLNSGDYLYSKNSLKIIKRLIKIYKNKCLNFKTLLKHQNKSFLIKNKIFNNNDFLSHPSFIRPPVKKNYFFSENFNILSDGIWMRENKKNLGVKKINIITTVHTLGGISTCPTFFSIKDNLKFSIYYGLKETIKYFLKKILNKKKYYELIYRKKYLIK